MSSSLEDKVEELKIEDSENVEPTDSDVKASQENVENTTDDSKAADAKKKNKKKKKKDKPAAPETAPETVIEEPKVLGELSENTTDEKLCAFCSKPGPIKRCSKRHPKCLPKMFCNETCEALAHEDKKAALAKKEASKVAAAKKKGSKIKNWKNTDSGQFWWHDQ